MLADHRLTPSVTSYLWTGDGDPLKAVFAHQILEGQLQFDLTFGRAAGIGCAVGYRDLLQCEGERWWGGGVIMVCCLAGITTIIMTVTIKR